MTARRTRLPGRYRPLKSGHQLGVVPPRKGLTSTDSESTSIPIRDALRSLYSALSVTSIRFYTAIGELEFSLISADNRHRYTPLPATRVVTLARIASCNHPSRTGKHLLPSIHPDAESAASASPASFACGSTSLSNPICCFSEGFVGYGAVVNAASESPQDPAGGLLARSSSVLSGAYLVGVPHNLDSLAYIAHLRLRPPSDLVTSSSAFNTTITLPLWHRLRELPVLAKRENPTVSAGNACICQPNMTRCGKNTHGVSRDAERGSWRRIVYPYEYKNKGQNTPRQTAPTSTDTVQCPAGRLTSSDGEERRADLSVFQQRPGSSIGLTGSFHRRREAYCMQLPDKANRRRKPPPRSINFVAHRLLTFSSGEVSGFLIFNTMVSGPAQAHKSEAL
ncbi:hypothetical protein C8F01DRAFT_1230360 [Mycena amicta]|nr:hypothetical protein C8F01DRAFT_1230360 [Mycena amicta]